jgi:hypothetical protein
MKRTKASLVAQVLHVLLHQAAQVHHPETRGGKKEVKKGKMSEASAGQLLMLPLVIRQKKGKEVPQKTSKHFLTKSSKW